MDGYRDGPRGLQWITSLLSIGFYPMMKNDTNMIGMERLGLNVAWEPQRAAVMAGEPQGAKKLRSEDAGLEVVAAGVVPILITRGIEKTNKDLVRI
ncbi:hypothetical protein Hanom_Chr16g01426111 [Helianthus anomalus]